MKVIVGLGNPGAPYAETRHNLGWQAVSRLAETQKVGFQKKTSWQAETTQARFDNDTVLLVHPLTFMNRSGDCVQRIINFYHLPLTELLIVQDELDFPLGTLTFTECGGTAGHNGIASIQETLSTKEYVRLRLGIGRPLGQIPLEDYVLQKFTSAEQPFVEQLLVRSTSAILTWIKDGLAVAMNQWNRSSARP